ncbi:MAG: sulfatase-like hydrolase/transferase [Cyclobacteriaceae bacterium]
MKFKLTLMFLKQLPLFLLTILLLSCRDKAPERPNFIIIFDDQHNSKHMGWTGLGEGIKTPNMDRLAAQSITFTNAYTSCPVCAPARHSVYTGHYASRHGVIMNDRPLSEEIPTLMELLAESGYTTANVGKMHFAPYNERHGFQYVLNHEFFADNAGISHFRPWLDREAKKRGLKAERYPHWSQADPSSDWLFEVNSLSFEHDVPIELTSEHWVTDNSIAFIEDQLKQRPGKPFLLHASYFAPHHPYGVVEEFNTYKPEDMKIPPSWTEEKANDFGNINQQKKDFPLSKKDYQKLKATYFGFISQLDYEMGRLLDFIDSNDELARNTIIVFITDHGDRMGEHGMLYKGGEGAMLEGSVGIPFMLRWPGKKPRMEKTPVSHIDIMPTFLKAAGIKPESDLPGIDLKTVVESKDIENTWKDRTVISEWLSPLPFRYIMARKGKHKFVADNSNGMFPDMQYELYDMEADTWEMENLAYEPGYESLVKEFEKTVLAHYNEQKEFLPATMPPATPRSKWDIQFPFKPWEQTKALK